MRFTSPDDALDEEMRVIARLRPRDQPSRLARRGDRRIHPAPKSPMKELIEMTRLGRLGHGVGVINDDHYDAFTAAPPAARTEVA